MLRPVLIREAGLALMLLTRLPAGGIVGPAPLPAASAVWAFPLAGALVGAAGAVVMLAGGAAGMLPVLAACWGLAAAMALSGGLHEDGLADMVDGFGGGRDTARKLEIMRDSRIGSYGALALLLATAIRLAALAQLPAAAFVAAGALSRGAMAVPLLLLGPARPEGLGVMMAGAGWRRWICLLLAGGIAAAALPAGHAAAAFAASVVAAMCVSLLARAQIGGFTGDVLGGCAVAAECAGLTAMACA